MDYQAVSNAFVQHYFRTFDNWEARNNLTSLYRPESMLAWEGNQQQGTQNIMSALTKPELKTIKTMISSTDATPSVNSGVLVVVTGSLAIDNAFDKPLNFTATFSLQPIPGQPGGFFIYSHIFRLIF
ncbi:Nuclear transport factor 2, Eukaryote [Penicillium expansum]|uniref:Nuclear transport factor 2 n=1 Tax=Penicillium expansum TaxID=27334 RepID=A0A0A2I3T9_PENEN|nr:Nuclear transport factor 2, Eukaryote [Penicillium expansum]KGO37772.1 Nuclear transport factor 2, Eukaryote [Penicillium expansum]KGO49877.1 Nuclear transport factor 2, Eukaryote [Penicillium expansum]KGO68620.1 Nuclear transport factor 2, Eukaryote [Penicillium expansum]